MSNFKNVKKECDILRHISGHPNVASLVEAYEDESHVHFILELCSGGMLYDSITAKGHYSEQVSKALCRVWIVCLGECLCRVTLMQVSTAHE